MISTNPVSKIGNFFREVKAEAKKVNWPTSKETAINTLLVIIFSVIVAAFLGFFDFIFSYILDTFLL